MKQSINYFSLALVGLLFSCKQFSTNEKVRIKFEAKSLAGKDVLLVYSDPLTLNVDTLALTKLDSTGNIDVSFIIPQTSFAFLSNRGRNWGIMPNFWRCFKNRH